MTIAKCTQTVLYTSSLTDIFGNPTHSDTPVSWSVDRTDIATIEQIDDYSAMVTFSGVLGEVIVSCTNGNFNATDNLQVTAGEAVAMVITATVS